MRYKCIEGFEIQRVDDEGFEVENSQFTIEKGSAWELIGCSEKYDEYDLVQMDGNKYGHMTINKASLDCYFKLIK